MHYQLQQNNRLMEQGDLQLHFSETHYKLNFFPDTFCCPNYSCLLFNHL